MQQMYSCPNCRAPVAYGQPQCTNCKMVFNWQVPQSQVQGQTQDGDDGPGLLQRIAGHRGTIIKISVGLVIVAALIVGGIAMQGEISKWFAPPVITSFSASVTKITEGQEVTLHWETAGASSVTISPGIGTVASSGSKIVSPEATITYTLVADKFTGSVRKSVTITVTGAPPSINSFSIIPDYIFFGQTATVSWGVTGATSVSVDPGLGTVSSSGSESVSPGSTTKYTLTASNGAGNSTASATLNVTESKAPIITTFGASSISIKAGEVSTLTWDVIGAKSISINQGIGGVASKGSTQVSPAATTVYSLIAAGDYGSANRSVTITVDTTGTSTGPAISKAPPAISTFTVNRNIISLGDNVTLTWAVSGARTISISPDVGAVPSSGWMMVIPVASTTYTLSAVNTFGTQTAETTVAVNRSPEGSAPVIRSFVAEPGSISEGGSSTLSWSVKGATLFTIDHGIGIPTSKYSQSVSPAATTTYTLTAINSYSTDNATATVTVVP